MLKNIKQKITKKNIGFLLTAVIVLLGSGVFVIYAQTAGSCEDLTKTYSCLSETLLRVAGSAYMAKDLVVNAGDKAGGKLSVFDNDGIEKFTVDSDGKITSPTISDVSGSNPTCGSGMSLIKNWNTQSWTFKDGTSSKSCSIGGWAMSNSGTPTCTIGDYYYANAVAPSGCVSNAFSYNCTDTGCLAGSTIICSASSWNRAICIGD